MTDLGDGVTIERIMSRNGVQLGVVVTHFEPGRRRFCGTRELFFNVNEVERFSPERIRWEVHSLPDRPLTLWPSLHCPRCRRHGWIADGRWVPV